MSRTSLRLDILEIPSDNEHDNYNTPFIDVELTSVRTQQKWALYILSQAILKCIPLILGFLQVDQTGNNKVWCPCSKTLQQWMDKWDIVLGSHKIRQHPTKEFPSAFCMEHVNLRE